jgi:hypothetical protein
MRDSPSYLLVIISSFYSSCAGFNVAPLCNVVVRSNGFPRAQQSSVRKYASNNNSADELLGKRRRSRSTPDNGKTTRRKNIINTAATMNTAVCIIPPDDAWDSIQRARHLARDTTFYKWPPAIRLFHPFAPPQSVPTLVGKLAEWIEEEGTKAILEMELKGSGDSMKEESKNGDDTTQPSSSSSSSTLLESFEVTLDSITILPHWEILQARIEALEERMPQRTLGESLAEKESRKRRAEGMALIEEEERKGLQRKQERDRKKRQRQKNKGKGIENEDQSEDDDTTNDEDGNQRRSFNGPCVLYLSPNEESRIALESLRETLRDELFPMYDAFSPSSSVSPYPEYLPRKVVSDTKAGASTSNAIKFKPLLPIARFPSVDAAVKVAKVLQRTWDPLTFNVTDIQFVSRQDDNTLHVNSFHSTSTSGVGFGDAGKTRSEDWDIPEVRHRRKHGTLSNDAANRMALTSSGEVEDVSKQGIYGCDAMVMLWGEEPEEELMEEEASLTMIMGDNDDELENSGTDFNEDHTDELYYQTGDINYDEIFATAEREYQRMETYEEFSSVFDLEPGAQIEEGEEGGGIEEWLDDGDGLDDEGATVVIGRAQFFLGAMRDFIGMPASSTIDGKDRIMGGGVSATARRRGAVHRLAESWSDGEYGRKDQDYLPK